MACALVAVHTAHQQRNEVLAATHPQRGAPPLSFSDRHRTLNQRWARQVLSWPQWPSTWAYHCWQRCTAQHCGIAHTKAGRRKGRWAQPQTAAARALHWRRWHCTRATTPSRSVTPSSAAPSTQNIQITSPGCGRSIAVERSAVAGAGSLAVGCPPPPLASAGPPQPSPPDGDHLDIVETL